MFENTHAKFHDIYQLHVVLTVNYAKKILSLCHSMKHTLCTLRMYVIRGVLLNGVLQFVVKNQQSSQ